MRKPAPRVVALALGSTMSLASAAAEARWFDLRAGVTAGGITGAGSNTTGRVKQRNFFHRVRGPATGFEIAAQLLGLGLSVSFVQVLGGAGEIGAPGQRFSTTGRGQIGGPTMPPTMPQPTSPTTEGATGGGTLTTLLLGFEREFTLRPQWVVRPRIAAGLAVGTLHPVDPPLGADDVSHKGFLGQAEVVFERYLNPFLGVGVSLIAGGHYLLGGDQIVNDPGNWSKGVQATALATVTAHLGL